MTTGEELGRLAWEQWGRHGVPVFPCGDKGDQKKVPLCKWKQEASCDEAAILQAFASRGDRAKYIGAKMGEESGLFAVDFDLYKGTRAQEFMDLLLISKCLPPTRIHKTMSGGLHYIYFTPDGVAVPRNSVPHDGVEIRGEGGYIVVPPTDGYEVQSDKTIDAPIALIQRLRRADDVFKSLSVSGLVGKIMAGDSFHEALTSIAAKLHSKGEDPAKVMKVMQDAMAGSVAANPRHHRHSRWLAIMEGKDGELARLSQSAFTKFNPRRDQIDVDAVADTVVEAVVTRNKDVTVGGFFSAAPAAFSGKTFKNPAKGASAAAQSNEPAAAAAPSVDEFPFSRAYNASKVEDEENKNFLIYPLVMEGDVVVLSAEPKAGKTLTAMSICLHAAAGVPFGDLTPLGPDGKPKKIPIVYFALEGQGAVRKRIKGWLNTYKSKYGLSGDPEDLRLFVVERPVNLADGEAKQELVDKLMLSDHYFKKRGWGGIGMVVFDTLTKAMPGKDQNSVEDTSEVFNVVDMMREVDLSPAVMFIHHNNKNSKSPRGSSNILAEPDTIISVSKVDPVMLNGVAVDCVEMSIYMARAIDDGQVYRFATLNVEIGENSQGIMEHAPVQEVLENYTALQTPAEATIQKAAQGSKRDFYEAVWQVLSDAPNMRMGFGQLARALGGKGRERALLYYNQHVNANTKEGAQQAWSVLLHDKQLPATLQGMSFLISDTGVTMEIDLGQAKIG